MKALSLNPYLSFSGFKEEITFWDNQNISRLTSEESNFLTSFLANDKHYVHSSNELKEINLVKKLIAKKVIGNYQFPLDSSSTDEEVMNTLQGVFPESHLVSADNFLSCNLENLSKIGNKKILFVNLKSSTIVIGPCLRSFEDYDKYHEILKHTWTAKRWESNVKVATKAQSDLSLLKLFIEELANANSGLKDTDLMTKLISFDLQNGLKNHEIIFSLSTKIENLNFKKEIDTYSSIYIEKNGFRSRPTSEVLTEVKKYIGPITGIADQIDELFINNIPVYRAFSKLQYLMPELYRNYYSMGKGTSAELAYISAMAELIERFFSMINPIKLSNGTEDLPHIKPENLILYSELQFKNNDKKETNYFKKIPEKYTGQDLEWVVAENIFESKNYLVPKEACVANNRLGTAFFLVTSNGAAAGTSYMDAILQGTFECVERDAASIWWYNQLEREQLHIESIEIDVVSQSLNWFQVQEKVFRVIDITSDFEIPCYAAISYVPTKRGSLKIGLGCHISSDIAITRAVTELIQAEGAHVFSNGSFAMDYSNYFIKDNYDLTFLNPPQFKKYISNSQIQINLKSFYEKFSKKVSELKLKLLVVNYTPVGSFFKVVRVIIPTLRTMMFELGPGRLYDVPVKMGHLMVPTKEDEINKHCLDI